MQPPRPAPDRLKENLHTNMVPRGFTCTLKFEKLLGIGSAHEKRALTLFLLWWGRGYIWAEEGRGVSRGDNGKPADLASDFLPPMGFRTELRLPADSVLS